MPTRPASPLPSRIVRHTAHNHPARSDCERVVPIIGQPVNTLTSVGITGMGIRLARQAKADPHPHPGAQWAGWALAAAGIGSAVYHGPGGRHSAWLHDITLLAPPIVLAIASEHDRHTKTEVLPGATIWATIGATIGGAAIIRFLFPGSQHGLSAASAAAVAGATWRRVQSSHAPHDATALVAAAITGGAGVAVHALSRTGAPMCRPDSLWQGHGLWHLLAGAATMISARGIGLHQRKTDRT